MRRLLGIGAVLLGVLGVLACAAAIGLGWWAAARTADRAARVAARLDRGLFEADARLERIEERLAAVRANLAETRGEAEKLAADNPDLPRVRSAIEQLLDRLLPTIDRAAALADSLRTMAAGLRAAEEVVIQLGGEIEQPSRPRAAADAIDRAAEVLNIPRARLDDLKSATALQLTRELVELAREAVAGSERLAEGLSDARREINAARGRTAERQDEFVFWVYLAGVANTLMWLWIGLGQLCLIGWGRRRFGSRIPTTTDPGAVRLA
jgi:DNA repair exonuclease SbcCD ATPase subunit